MISRDEIKIKERYILEEISKNTDKKELEKLKHSLRTYLVIDNLLSKDYRFSILIDSLISKHYKLTNECDNVNKKLTTINDYEQRNRKNTARAEASGNGKLLELSGRNTSVGQAYPA